MQMAAGRNYQMCMGNARDVRERRSPNSAHGKRHCRTFAFAFKLSDVV